MLVARVRNVAGLAIWWLQLGIQIQRIKPGCPQQNGRHERTHLTLKKEATKPASFNFLQQQERFDQFATVYHQERPHQASGGAYPGAIYTPSGRVYAPPPEPEGRLPGRDPKRSGAPEGIRTPDPQVRSQPEEPETPPESPEDPSPSRTSHARGARRHGEGLDEELERAARR